MTPQLKTPPTAVRPYLKSIVYQLNCICLRLDRIEQCVNKDNQTYLRLKEALADHESWINWGRVCDQQGNSLQNLTIRLYDHDLGCDDRLGIVKTDANGEFCIVYTDQQFQDCFAETRPNLYLIGEDMEGNRVFQCDRPLRWRTEHLERFYITVNTDIPGPK